MEICRAQKSDIEKLINLRLEYLNSDYGKLKPEQEKEIVSQLETYFITHIDRDFIAYIANDLHRGIAGAFLVISEKPANPNFITGKTGVILNVYTRPEYRKQGIATRLLTELIREARALNLSYLELSSTREGEPVYRKLGFKEKELHYKELRLNLISENYE